MRVALPLSIASAVTDFADNDAATADCVWELNIFGHGTGAGIGDSALEACW